MIASSIFSMDSNSIALTRELKNGGVGKDTHQNLHKYFQEKRNSANVVSNDDNDEEEILRADLDTCSTHAICDASCTPDHLEILHFCSAVRTPELTNSMHGFLAFGPTWF
jgi:hypothetical protein